MVNKKSLLNKINKKLLILIIFIVVFVFLLSIKRCASCAYRLSDKNFVGVCAQMCQERAPLWKLALFNFTGIKF